MNPLLPREQAQIQWRKVNRRSSILLTENYEDFFVDVTAAYDFVWHRGPLQDKHIVRMIMELDRNFGFGQVSPLLPLSSSKARFAGSKTVFLSD